MTGAQLSPPKRNILASPLVLSDAARQSHAPHAYVQIKTGCMMPHSSGAAKEKWGEKSVSDENERTRSTAKIDKSSPRR